MKFRRSKKFMNLKSKLFVGAVALTMVLGMAIPASAQTTADLTAQINALLAQIAQLQAQIGGGSSAVATTFNTNLTVGSKGADVSALQSFLVGKGFLTMPAGVAMGNFGPLTKTALAGYQSANGISPAAGYFGPVTRAKVNGAGGAVTGTTNVPAGAITTPGAEGTVTVTGSNGSVVSSAYAGDAKDKILGFRVQAAGSDVAVQRVKVDLGANTTEYNKIFSSLYLIDDAGNTLSSLVLNTSSVVKDSGEYYATLTGANSVVAKGTTRQYYIAADLYPSIDSTLQTSYTVQLANDGVRAADGAGIDQYGPTTGSTVSSSVSVTGNLTDLATLTMSSDPATPVANVVAANQGSNNDQYDQLPILTFDLMAKKDNIQVTDAVLCIGKSGGGTANASTTYYLFDGSSIVGTAAAAASTTKGVYCGTFSNINYNVPKDTTKALTLKADIRSANGTLANFISSTTAVSYFTAQSSSGSTITYAYKSGSVIGNTVSALKAGPVITLNSKPVLIASGAPQIGGTSAPSTSTLSATFSVHIQAIGGSVMFGTVASSAPAFATSTNGSPVNGFTVYVNDSANTTFLGVSTSTSYTFPSQCATAGYTNSCVLSENSSMDVPVTFMTQGRSTNGVAVTTGSYSIQMSKVYYNGSGSSMTFMDTLTDWRTNNVSFP
jgi:hypothetical protein